MSSAALGQEPGLVPGPCDVLVVGAGPAGSAAAKVLAQAGLNVVLMDQHDFPRDKICGDGLIPDAHAALRRLGLLELVMARAERISHVRCVGPSGGAIDVPGSLAVLPRRELDMLLCEAARAAGAQWLAPARFEKTLDDANGQVVGARISIAGQAHDLQARWVLLATGAVPKALIAAGMCERHTPTGVALRGYVHAPELVGKIEHMEVIWNRKVRPGYGWIFPAPGGVFNIGAGVTDSHEVDSQVGGAAKGSKAKATNLRRLFDDFCASYPPAAELMRQGKLLGDLKGAPLRCTLEGARWTRPGLMVCGEAAGSTYSFTGEGIGKAMETGMLAADAVLAGERQRWPEAQVRAQYEAGLNALKPKFQLYARANRINAFPWLADLLIWRARKSPRLLQRMSGVLNETSNPGHLVSFSGIRKVFLE